MDGVPYLFCDAVFASLKSLHPACEEVTKLDLKNNSCWLTTALNHRDKGLTLDLAVDLTPKGICYHFTQYRTDGVTDYSFDEVQKTNRKYLRIDSVKITDGNANILGLKSFPVNERSMKKISNYIRPAFSRCSVVLSLPNYTYNELHWKTLAPLEECVYEDIEITDYCDAAITFLMKQLHKESLSRVNIKFPCPDELRSSLEEFYAEHDRSVLGAINIYYHRESPSSLAIKRRLNDITQRLEDLKEDLQKNLVDREKTKVFITGLLLLLLCFVVFALEYFQYL
uniref:Recep_L_domain domain-containing protein n=1 Tax=Steinernema glaseri TaxID=37863 RepID=A0A1I7ZE00_9BILA